MKWWYQLKTNPRWIRLVNWEFWPTFMFYGPMVPLFCWMALRYRHLCFFTTANPKIFTGGTGMESKFKTLLLIPPEYRPITIYVPSGQAYAEVQANLHKENIAFPVILKPDVGYRGLLVHLVKSEPELQALLSTYQVNFIIQEYIPYPEEFGVLYYRFPHQKTGQISSITLKDFLHVFGDGRSSVRELMLKKSRTSLQFERMQEERAELMNKVPAPGEKVYLGKIGNHSRGTTFLNGNHLIDQQLIETFDKISSQIDGFFYGRFDVKCPDFETLKAGEAIKIIEINGILAEPAHIYDPRKSNYWKALRDIAKHWILIGRIGAKSHQMGEPYLPARSLVQAISNHLTYLRNIKAMARKQV